MTDELKTLNDYEEQALISWQATTFRNVLRVDAILWVKELQKENMPYAWLSGQGYAPEGATEILIEWIMHRYNLTEDDLK